MEIPFAENRDWENFKDLHIILNRSGGGWIGEVIGVPGCEAYGSSLEECQVNTLIVILDRFANHLLRTMEIEAPEEEKRSVDSYASNCFGEGLPSISIINALTRKTQVVVSVSKSHQSQPIQVDESHEDTESRGGQRILTLLGLSQEASEAEVYQAIKDLKDSLSDAESRLLQIEIEQVVAQNKASISDMEGFKRLYIEYGKDVAIAFLKVMQGKTGETVD